MRRAARKEPHIRKNCEKRESGKSWGKSRGEVGGGMKERATRGVGTRGAHNTQSKCRNGGGGGGR